MNVFNKKNLVYIGIGLALAILIELSVVLILHFTIDNRETNNVLDQLHDIDDVILEKVHQVIDLVEHNLRRNAAIFRVNGLLISKKDYVDYIQFNSLPINKSVEAYYWVSEIEHDFRAEYEEFGQDHILNDFAIREFDPESETLIPSTDKSVYYPLVYSEPPLSSGDSIIGFDLLSHPSTAPFVQIPLSKPELTGSFRVGLSRQIDENPNSYGIVLSYPSFKSKFNLDTSNINGYMSGIINTFDIFNQAIDSIYQNVNRTYIDVFVFDITDDPFIDLRAYNLSLLYKENKREYDDIWFVDNMTMVESFGLHNYEIPIADRDWSVYLKYSEEYIESIDGTNSRIIPTTLGVIFILLDVIGVVLILLYLYVIASIKRKRDQERQKMVIANQMLNYVNHEIRNPLNSITGLVSFVIEILMEKIENYTDEKIEDIPFNKVDLVGLVSDLSTVDRSCILLRHIVDDILDIRKLENGKILLDNQWHDIKQIIHILERIIEPKLSEKPDLKLIINIEPEDIQMFVDEYRLNQILINFLTNSIKYTDEGHIKLEIEKIDKNVNFMVSDTGCGIKDEEKPKIFNMFHQVSAKDASRHGGTGLGLYLCKMMVERMEGEIGFTSRYGSGSTFWFKLPIENSEKASSVDGDEMV